MACTRVAACLAEGWNHVAAEAHRRWLVHLLDLDDRACLDRTVSCHDRYCAVALGENLAPIRDRRHGGIKAGPGKQAGQVADRAVGIPAGGDQLAGGVPTAKWRIFRADHDGRRRADQGPTLGILAGCGRDPTTRDAGQQDDSHPAGAATVGSTMIHDRLLSSRSARGGGRAESEAPRARRFRFVAMQSKECLRARSPNCLIIE